MKNKKIKRILIILLSIVAILFFVPVIFLLIGYIFGLGPIPS